MKIKVVLAMMLFAGVFVTSVSGQSAVSLNEEQAVRGQALYYQHCLQCHGETMGGIEQAPPLTGPQFSRNWQEESLWSLVERMGTMPPDKPGTLSRQEIVDTLTYVLWYNGLPLGGEPLSTDQGVLVQMPFTLPAFGQ